MDEPSTSSKANVIRKNKIEMVCLLFIYYMYNIHRPNFKMPPLWTMLNSKPVEQNKEQYITSTFEIAIDVRMIKIGHVLNNKSDQLLSFLR